METSVVKDMEVVIAYRRLTETAVEKDVVCQETYPGNIVYADDADATYEFGVIEQGDLPLHFMDGLFDGHTIRVGYEKEVKSVPIDW